MNISERVISSRDLRADLTRSKIDQTMARCGSFSRVLRPNRITSRYESHESNCHASTTCSHSMIKNGSENLFSLVS